MTTATDTAGNRVVRKIRVRAIAFFALALMAGVGAVLLVKMQLERARASAVAAPVYAGEVVVAAMDVPIAMVLEQKHLEVVSWPAEHMPVGSFSQVENLVGKSLVRAMVKGEPVLTERIASEDSGRGLAAILPEGTRAMAVKVDQVIGVAGFVHPGDFVDVITTMKTDEETRGRLGRHAARVSKIILQNIRVLAVGEHMSTEGRKPVKVQVVTLAVSADQSERLALASQHGKVQLTMRSRLDQTPVATAGVTPLTLLAADEGAETVLPGEDYRRSSRRSSRRRSRRSRHELVAAESQDVVVPNPVVEILRAGKVEERTLRRTADSE